MKPNFLQSLWEKIKNAGNPKSHAADDSHKPTAKVPPYRYRTIQHHPSAYEIQHRAAEQSYWQEQLRLAKELNLLTKSLNSITISATVAAGIAAFVGLGSLYILNDTLKETRRATDNAIKSVHEDKRAWVGVMEVTALDELTAGKPLGVRAAVGNSGESPAVYVSVHGQLSLLIKEVGDSRIPLSWNASYVPCTEDKRRWDDVISGAMILPGANTGGLNRLSQPIPKEYIELVRKEKLIIPDSQEHSQEFLMVPIAPETPLNVPRHMELFFVGCINYFDVFHNAHRTTFCFEYAYSRELAATFPKGAFSACKQGNGAD